MEMDATRDLQANTTTTVMRQQTRILAFGTDLGYLVLMFSNL